MADYVFTITSRSVKTKDNAEFVKVFQDLGFEESCIIDDCAFVGSYGEAYWDDDSMIVVREKATGKVIGAYNPYCNAEDLDMYLNQESISLPEDTEAEDLYEEIDIETYIKSMLLDGEAFVLTEAGNEKLRYNNGWAIIITKDETKCFDITRLIDTFLEDKGLLGK